MPSYPVPYYDLMRHEQGLLKKKRRKHKTKRSLREIKKHWNLFEQTSMDTKDLDDIPELWPQIQRHRLPTIQYTAREVTSGLHFLAYAYERSLAHSSIFVDLLVDHLSRCGVDLTDRCVQTDNGSEFIGSWNARHDSAFTRRVADAGAVHHTIPPGAHTFQADVETAHRLIEDELYEVESFSGLANFLFKANTYNLWFNFARRNSYKEDQTPWEIAHQKQPNISKDIAAFPVVLLDRYLPPLAASGGYHVVPDPWVVS